MLCTTATNTSDCLGPEKPWGSGSLPWTGNGHFGGHRAYLDHLRDTIKTRQDDEVLSCRLVRDRYSQLYSLWHRTQATSGYQFTTATSMIVSQVYIALTVSCKCVLIKYLLNTAIQRYHGISDDRASLSR